MYITSAIFNTTVLYNLKTTCTTAMDNKLLIQQIKSLYNISETNCVLLFYCLKSPFDVIISLELKRVYFVQQDQTEKHTHFAR